MRRWSEWYPGGRMSGSVRHVGGITPLMHFTGKGTEIIYVPTTCRVCGELVQIDAEVW
jgi:hypothetical protein